MSQTMATQTWLSMHPLREDADWLVLSENDDCGYGNDSDINDDTMEWMHAESASQAMVACPMPNPHAESHVGVPAAPTTFSDPECWPAFPTNYFDALGHKHIRWGSKYKSLKYSVDAHNLESSPGGIDGFASKWVLPSFGNWLAERQLTEHLSLTHGCGQLAIGSSHAYNFLKYQYNPTKDQQQPASTVRVYHGTFVECLARILWTGRFHASDLSLGLGMENHFHKPAVFTADTMDHAIRYAWPSNMFGDNFYYGVV